MKQALKVAKQALEIGEVPVGCVIVLRKDLLANDNSKEQLITDKNVSSTCSMHINYIRTKKCIECKKDNNGDHGHTVVGGEKETNQLMTDKNNEREEVTKQHESHDHHDEEDFLEQAYISSPQVIISHGANQVNATRDATRHAECVAIDRMLTGGMVSDRVRLPQHVFLKT